MILTHVTYNNPQVKSLLGSKKSFLLVLIELLSLSNEDLIEAIAKVIQNLSWDTNYISMQTMRDLKTVTHLTTVSLFVFFLGNFLMITIHLCNRFHRQC